MNEQLLILFVKNLVPGKVKTRLAREIGVDRALNVYEHLIDHTCFIAEKVQATRMVFYSDYLETGDIFSHDLFKRHVQRGETLGDRMIDAFQRGFDSKFKKVVLIGSDCYSLNEKHLEKAFKALDKDDAVVGPAKDGGYYLIGLKAPHPELFDGKTYSHPLVLQELQDSLEQHKLSFTLLEKLADIDTLKDLKSSGMDLDFLD